MTLLITTSEAARCLRILAEQAAPIVAADLASRLRIAGTRETQRRRVREIIKHLRENGSRIVATNREGYWLTEEDATWAEYNEGRSIDAKRILAETYERKRQLAERRQMPLFAPPILAAHEV